MCECISYDNGHCDYFDVQVGDLTHGCTRGRNGLSHQKANSKSDVILATTFQSDPYPDARVSSF